MGERHRYRRRRERTVLALRIDLDLDTFRYRKWGGWQEAKAGDWLLDNDGDVYTVDAEVFERTYRRVGPGQYIKTTHVWAERATEPGVVSTLEGSTEYQAGDYIVSNDEEGHDRYAVDRSRFESLYERD